MRWNGAMGELGGRTLRVLVGDTRPLVGAGLAALMTALGHAVVDIVDSGAAAETAIKAGGIDIAVLDIALAMPSPLALLGRSVAIVVTAPDAEHAGVLEAVEAGVNGLVLKSQGADGLAQCLVSVAGGRQWHDRQVTARAADRREARGGAQRLTRREQDVVRLVATGQRNRNIAGALGISEGTVKMHLHNVYAKLGVESRTQLAMDRRLPTLV